MKNKTFSFPNIPAEIVILMTQDLQSYGNSVVLFREDEGFKRIDPKDWLDRWLVKRPPPSAGGDVHKAANGYVGGLKSQRSNAGWSDIFDAFAAGAAWQEDRTPGGKGTPEFDAGYVAGLRDGRAEDGEPTDQAEDIETNRYRSLMAMLDAINKTTVELKPAVPGPSSRAMLDEFQSVRDILQAMYENLKTETKWAKEGIADLIVDVGQKVEAVQSQLIDVELIAARTESYVEPDRFSLHDVPAPEDPRAAAVAAAKEELRKQVEDAQHMAKVLESREAYKPGDCNFVDRSGRPIRDLGADTVPSDESGQSAGFASSRVIPVPRWAGEVVAITTWCGELIVACKGGVFRFMDGELVPMRFVAE